MSWTLNLPKGGSPPFGPCQGASSTFCDLVSFMAVVVLGEVVSAVAPAGFFCSVAQAQRAMASMVKRRIILFLMVSRT